MSPAQKQIHLARQAIRKKPDRHEPHNALALALTRRARETADPAYYQQAHETLRESFRLAPDNPQGRKVQAWVLLGQHEFARALEIAESLKKRFPDDLMLYGILTDAYVELGDYDKAEEAAQWMLDRQPAHVPALTRGAYLRELFGDIEGAVELMQQAYQRTPEHDVEDRAWILTHIAHLELATGDSEAADKLLQEALKLYPNYHYALAELAEVRAAQGRSAEAAQVRRQHVEAAPHPENFYYLGQSLQRAGKAEEAEAAFQRFEEAAREEMDNNDNANRELILYYADEGQKPAEAVRIARREAERRQDVLTLDAYAWALHAAGDHGEARKQIEKALAVGIRDARMLYHAGAIAAKQGDRTAAESYLQKSLDLNRRSEVAEPARELLASLPDKAAPSAPSTGESRP